MKHALKVIGIGVALGLVLLFLKQSLHISEEVFMIYFWILGVGILVVAVLFNFFYICSYQKKMKVAALLLDQGKTKEYIQAVEELRKRAKGRYLQNLFTLNLTAGYCDLKEYAKATELFKSLENVRLPCDLKLVYHINLCICYFYDEQTEKALALYTSQQTLFHSPLAAKLYGGNIAVMDVFVLVEQREYGRAKKLLTTAREAWPDSRLQADFAYLEEKLQHEQEKEFQ